MDGPHGLSPLANCAFAFALVAYSQPPPLDTGQRVGISRQLPPTGSHARSNHHARWETRVPRQRLRDRVICDLKSPPPPGWRRAPTIAAEFMVSPQDLRSKLAVVGGWAKDFSRGFVESMAATICDFTATAYDGQHHHVPGNSLRGQDVAAIRIIHAATLGDRPNGHERALC